jgi:tRNA pseudouridine38-40 synthase
VQTVLERAIGAVTQEAVRVVGSGRTDAGAHALGQVVAFSTRSEIPADRLCAALNAHLPRDMAAVEAAEVGADFHPRYDATSRLYRYLVWNRRVRSPFWEGRAAHVPHPLDVVRMDRAAQELVGQRDFGAFVPAALTGNRTRAMHSASCRRDGDLISIELEASGFMKQMVRAIVGTLVEVGRGACSPADLQAILNSGSRGAAGATMPAAGLYLVAVRYPSRPGRETNGASLCAAPHLTKEK